jgi:hypothetical protein
MKLWADAKATIGALTPPEGFMAYATDTDEIGTYDGASWNWLAAGEQAHIVDADGTLADITTKFNTLLTELEAFGILASS